MKKILLLMLLFIAPSLAFGEGKTIMLQYGGPDWSDITITGGTIDGAVIGGTTPAAIAGTTITATGTILGMVNVSSKTGAYTVGTDDAREVGGTLFISTGAPTYTLPTAAAGMSLCFMQGQGRTDIITVTPASGDYLVVDGARGTAATAYASAGAANEKLCIVCADTDDWYVTSEVGTWSE